MREPKEISIPHFDSEIRVRITPLSAYKTESLMIKIALALNLPSVAAVASMDSQALLGALQTAQGINLEAVTGILNELLGCCERITDKGASIKLTPGTVDGQISDPETLVLLHLASIKANLGFFFNGGTSAFLAKARGVLSALD